MAKKTYYAVRKGRVTGIFRTWDECSSHVTGFVGAQFKGFSSQADADTYMQHNSSILPVSSISHSKEKRVVSKRSHDDLIDLTIEKRQRLSECIVISDDDEVIVTAPAHTGPLCIYTDGACSSNGKSGARGGVGVYFGKNNPRNISEPLKGSNQTNNRAELTAIIRALDVCVNEPKAMMKPGVKIFSDSKYCIDGATKWMKGWERKAWKKSDGSGVLNCDLWKVHVKGHSGDVGNDAADELARLGAAV